MPRLIRLHQPVGIWLLLWPTLWALWIAGEGRPDQRVFIVFVLGTVVLRSAGCIINDYADRKIDAHVWRTKDRPLATGEVSVPEALTLFVVLMLVGLGLVLTMNRLTVFLAVIGALITIVLSVYQTVHLLSPVGTRHRLFLGACPWRSRPSSGRCRRSAGRCSP